MNFLHITINLIFEKATHDKIVELIEKMLDAKNHW